jgi:ATP-dependent helicase Lhr and Lhr-like helicase
MSISENLLQWFQQKGWQMHSYQQEMFKLFAEAKSTLLIAPTGGGKTLASFLPSLMDIAKTKTKGLHTLYISPLKALTSDIQRNLLAPITEMKLNISVDTRTGDTSSYRRTRQRTKPPQVLLTTPESLMLLLSYPNAQEYFSHLKSIIIDELHSFVSTKRGDLTALALAQLNNFSPSALRFGLSATVARPEELAAWLSPVNCKAEILNVKATQKPLVHILNHSSQIPYGGFMAKYAVDDIYQTIAKNKMTIIFVNTRAQAEFIFRQIWQVNSQNFPIAIYHGSLSKEQRIKTEGLTFQGNLKAIVATSALELGIDWGNIDCVIQVGAPKGVSRLLQRIGRSNHQFDKASLAKLVPSNCFEALECQAAIDAIAAGKLDGEELSVGSLDVIVQFIMNCACSAPISAEKLYQIICSAFPYQQLEKTVFMQLFQFAVNGGYTLQHYEQYQRLQQNPDYSYSVSSLKVIRRHRQNIGTIIESARLKVKVLFKKKAKVLGDIEETFAQQLTPGDTFLFAGEVLEFVTIRDMFVETRKAKANESKLPSYEGGTMPLSTFLAEAVRQLINSPERWINLPSKVVAWLDLQRKYSALPAKDTILVEYFSYKKLFYCVIYSFEGRRANYTLGMLLTRRMESLHLKPVGFTVTDYGLAIGSLKCIDDRHIHDLLTENILHNEFEHWLNQSPLLKRTFRQVAIISGLTERQLAGTRKTMKQVTFSTDLIYDVLMRYEPKHILLAITRHDVDKTLLDLHRLSLMLQRFQGKIIVKSLARPSPMAIPILTTFKTERVHGAAIDELLSFAAQEAEANELMEEVRFSVQY